MFCNYVSHSSVQRVWAMHGLKPHLTRASSSTSGQSLVRMFSILSSFSLDPPDKTLVRQTPL